MQNTLISPGDLRFPASIPQLGLPLLAILFLRRLQTKLLASFLVCACLLAIISFALVGWEGTRSLVHLLSSGSLSHDHSEVTRTYGDTPARHAKPVWLLLRGRRLCFATASGHDDSGCALNLCGVVDYASQPNPGAGQRGFAVALLCSMLITYHMYLHDFTLLLVPMALLRTRMALYTGLATYASAISAVP